MIRGEVVRIPTVPSGLEEGENLKNNQINKYKEGKVKFNKVLDEDMDGCGNERVNTTDVISV